MGRRVRDLFISLHLDNKIPEALALEQVEFDPPNTPPVFPMQFEYAEDDNYPNGFFHITRTK